MEFPSLSKLRPYPRVRARASRRDFLKILAYSAVGTAPGARQLAHAAIRPLGMELTRERAVFTLGDQPAWVVDTRRFAGRPRIGIERNDDAVRIDLTGARLPGTELSADLSCRLRKSAAGWRMTLRLDVVPFEVFDLPFEPWLDGQLAAVCELAAEHVGSRIGDVLGATMNGHLTARFSPSWELSLLGDDALALSWDGVRVPTGYTQIALAEPDDPSLFELPAARRTVLRMDRDTEAWPAQAMLPQSHPGRFTAAADAFDVLWVEAGESRRGRTQVALCAQTGARHNALRFQPGARLLGSDGGVFSLGLRDAVVVRTIGSVPGETVIAARFATDPARLYDAGCTIELCDPPDGDPPFHAVLNGQALTALHCAPRLRAVSAPMADAWTGTSRFPNDARLVFTDGAAYAMPLLAQRDADESRPIRPLLRTVPIQPATPLEPAPTAPSGRQTVPPSRVPAPTGRAVTPVVPPSGRVLVPPTVRQPTVPAAPVRPVVPAAPGVMPLRPGTVVLPDLTVAVIRREDFLHLSFEFANLRLIEQDGLRLVRRDPSKPAFITAEFPPQNIHEEALFESESGKDPAKAPPVQSRLAGPSRLVFRVPDTAQSIPYTLADLLQACGSYDLSVPRTAQPPPPKPTARLSGKPSAQLGTRPGSAAADGSVRARQADSLQLRPGTMTLLPGGPDKDKPPSRFESIIEMPYRLWLAPHAGAAWAHARQPVVGHRGRVELWHTRLGVRGGGGVVIENDDYHRTLRAVWSPDYDQQAVPPAETGPFRSTLDARDRHEIVALTSDFRIPGYTPLPIWARRMMLTSLGAWLDSRGSWNPPCDPAAHNAPTVPAPPGRVRPGALGRFVPLELKPKDPCPPGTTGQCPGAWLTIEEWRHRATMGRDHYVRVVYKGYLFPFGHRASLVKVTERKFRLVEEGPLKGNVAAYLYQRVFIVVREPELTYPVQDPLDRKNPFRRIRLTTLVTPNLDKPELSDIGGAKRQAFWPSVGGQPFPFHLVAEDWRGENSDFTAPLIFLDQDWAKTKSRVDTAIGEYTAAAVVERRRRRWDGQSVAFAEVAPANPAATTLETESITFTARSLECLTGDRPAFLPQVDEARVRIPAVEALTGGQPSTIRIAEPYVKHAFGGNNAGGEVFAEVVGASPLSFGAERSGGVATPNINIAGISRSSGPVGGAPGADGNAAAGLEEFAGGGFDPEQFFAGAATEAMILGGIRLFELFASRLNSSDAPKLVNTPVYQNDRLVAVETRLSWEPPVSPRVPVFVADKGGKTKFRLDATIVNRLEGGEPEQVIEGSITNFSIDLLGGAASFIEIEFARFDFSSRSGSKMEVVPEIRDVRFKGPLAYVNELAEYLSSSSDNGGGGVSIDVSPSGVTAGFDIAIPTITTGVMTLQNIAFSAGITVPFSGDPMRARFAFCEKDNPFLLTIYCFGGGGYVGLSVGLDGVEQLEFAFEFGASIALDIGVASGGVEVMAGIYIKMEKNECQLTGYLRMGGELNVLAIVRISVEFNMALTHDTASNKTWGECLLTVEIEILFFSASVSMHVRREFSQPTHLPFRDMMSNPEWTRYCEAFA